MCGIRVDVEGGDRIASIRGDDDDPFSRGYLCPKAVALRDVHEDPDRLERPLLRVGERWEPMEWDDALELTAERLHAIQREHGNDAVATYAGNPTVHNLGAMIFAPMLFRALRTRHGYSATSVDQLPHMLAAHLMFGHQLLLPIPDVDRTEHMLVIGANPLASNGSLMTAPGIKRRLRAIQERGGRVVVVDPRRTETAAMADEHLFVRPGTDALLLLAMLHTIVEEERERLGRLAPLVEGLDEVRAIARRFSPERVAARAGIGADTIRRLARELASAERAVVYARMGASTQAFGTLCQWLTNVLNIVTGNLDREGGAMFTTPAIDALRLPRGFGVSRGSFGRWRSRVRGLPEFGGELPVATLAEEIREEGEGRVRALLTVAGNPALSAPNGAELERALTKLDFMVSIDLYLNETTRHAHVILPPTGPLERGHYDVAFHLLAVRNTAKYSPPLFAPKPGARHDWQILHGLMTRLEARKQPGLGARVRRLLRDGVLGRLGPEGVIDLGLRLGPHRGMSLRKLREAPHGIDLGPLEPRLPERLFRDRIALAPKAIVEDVARLEATLEAKPAISLDGELALIGRRHLRSNNSWMHNAAGLMSGKERCTLVMHPDDARARAIESGARVRVSSRVGSVTVPVEITSDVMRGVVSLPHGFGHTREGVRLRVAAEHAGASINDLTDDQAIDALSGNAAFSGVAVRVEPALTSRPT